MNVSGVTLRCGQGAGRRKFATLLLRLFLARIHFCGNQLFLIFAPHCVTTWCHNSTNVSPFCLWNDSAVCVMLHTRFRLHIDVLLKQRVDES